MTKLDPGKDRVSSTSNERSARQILERLSRQVQVSTAVAQEIAGSQNLDELFQRVVRLVKDRFGYYHVQLLRFDARANALALAAGSGEVGARMRADDHAIPLGVGLIGAAAQNCQTILRPTLQDDPDWQPNPLLPKTRGEVAVPILWQAEVLGVLDVQSSTAGALNAEDCLLLEGLCGQIAIAIQNTHLVSELRTSQARTEQVLSDLSRERALLRTLIDTLPHQVFAKDRQSRFTLNNLAHLRLLGCETQEDALGKTDMDVFPSDDALVYFQDEQRLMELGVALVDHEEEVVNNETGERGWNAVSKVPLLDQQGHVIGLVGVARDVTDRKLADTRVEALVKERSHQLVISEERYRLMAQQTGQMVYDIDIASNQITWAGAIEKLTGYSEAEFAGFDQQAWAKLIHPDDRERVLDVLQESVQTNQDYQMQYRFRRKDGSYYDVEDRGGFLVDDETGSPIRMLGVQADITERKRLESELRENVDRLRSVFDNMHDTFYRTDVEGRLIWVSPSIYKLLDVDAGVQIIGRNAQEFYASPEQRDELLNVLQETGQVQDYELVLRKPDGALLTVSANSHFYYAADGSLAGVEGTFRNITERKRLEQVTQASQQRLALLAANLPGIVFILDKEGIFQISEGRGLAELGMQPGQVVGLSAYEVYKDIPQISADIRRCLEAAQAFVTVVTVGPFDYETRYVPLLNDEGEVIGALGVSLNVTERVRAAEAAREAFERRGRQVQISTQVAQEFFTAPDLHALFERVVTLVKERFGYSYTQFFRYEPALDSLVLAAGYGETGRMILDTGSRIPFGTNVLAGMAAQGETVLQSDLGSLVGWQPDPLLPHVRGEMAVPVRLRERILGVLDVFSDQAGVLGEDDRLLLEGLCGQIAIAVEDIRLRQEMQERLQELDNLYRDTSRQGWELFRETSHSVQEYYFDQLAVQPAAGIWLAETQQAIDGNDTILPGEGREALAIPLALRGEVIGALAIQEDGQQPISSQDLSLITAIAEQVVLALESARLFEQTQMALAETETLYSIIAELNAADSFADILKALAERTLLGAAKPLLLLAVFDRPMNASQRSEWIFPVASQSQMGIQVAERYPLSAFEPVPNTLFTDQPVALNNLAGDHRLDRVTRTLFQEVFQAQSSIVIPLLLGSQVIGFVQGYFDRPTTFSAAEQSRLMAVAGQAAIAVQSRLLLEQAQSRARQEQRIREVTAQVFSASDVDTIMRRAVEQVGQVLGLPAYIYLGQRTDGQRTDGQRTDGQQTDGKGSAGSNSHPAALPESAPLPEQQPASEIAALAEADSQPGEAELPGAV